jgi:hypothetical protein
MKHLRSSYSTLDLYLEILGDNTNLRPICFKWLFTDDIRGSGRQMVHLRLESHNEKSLTVGSHSLISHCHL